MSEITIASPREEKKLLKQSRINKRIWELDAARGLFIICVIIIHCVFDLQFFFDLDLKTPAIFDFIQVNGGVLFILLSGICVTLGSRSLFRGTVVFASGMLITIVTYVMGVIDPANKSLLIQFGILHLLGICMITYPLYKKFPKILVGILGIAIIITGYYFTTFYVENENLFMIGLVSRGFYAGDFFPILPNMGWFMIGTILGKLLYNNKKSLFPNAPFHTPPIRFLTFCGRHSLIIYLVHQPLVYGLFSLLSILL